MWELIAARHGRIPPSRMADRDLGDTIVIRMDATIQIAHIDKEQAAGTFKGTWGHHSLTAWCDNTSESLALRLRPGYSQTPAPTPRAITSRYSARRSPRSRPGIGGIC